MISAAPGAASTPEPASGAAPAAPRGTGFAHALHHALHHGRHHHGAHHAHHARHHAPNPVVVGPVAGAAVDQAMAAEHVPQAWRHSLLFIVAQESGGRVGVRNTTDSARGLFQLTRASWHLNPEGAASFGNAREEAQGGIRYIEARYTTADNAARFWQAHHWY